MSLDNDLRNWAEEVDYNLKFTVEMSERCWRKIGEGMKEDRKWYEKFFIVLNRMNRKVPFKIVVPVAVVALVIIILFKGVNSIKDIFYKTPTNQSISADKEVKDEKKSEEKPVDEEPVKEEPKTEEKTEEKKELVIKNSIDNEDYGNGGSVDIQLPGHSEKYRLLVTKEDMKIQQAYQNRPVRLYLKINSEEVIFESIFNDGVFVSVADFDKTDNDIDIYIIETTTNILCRMYIYKFNGTSLQKYAELEIYSHKFKYDEEGNIYYWYSSSDTMEINKCFNYKTKVSSEITDPKLKNQLNQ